MFRPSDLFSEEYSEILRRRDEIKSIVLRAKQELAGSKLYGKFIDTSNPEDLIAILYMLYKDYELYHERL